MSNSKAKKVNSTLAPAANDVMDRTIESLAAAITNSRQQQEAEAKRQTILQFMELEPPAFNGSADPLEAENWIRALEKRFDILHCTDEQRVTYATFLLKGNADYWWDSIKTGFNEPVTWSMFKDAFLTHYFPKFYKHQKEEEFLKLEQGNMTVQEYNVKFIGLSRFAPYIASDKAAMVRFFLRGLKPSLYRQLAVLELTEYQDLVNRARLVEFYSEEIQQGREQKRRRLNGPEIVNA